VYTDQQIDQDVHELFRKDSRVKGTMGHTPMSKKPGCISGNRKFFSHTVVGRWNSLEFWIQNTCHLMSVPSTGDKNKLRLID